MEAHFRMECQLGRDENVASMWTQPCLREGEPVRRLARGITQHAHASPSVVTCCAWVDGAGAPTHCVVRVLSVGYGFA